MAFNLDKLKNLLYGKGLMISVNQEKIVPPDPITASEKKQTLQRLTQVIQYRLVSSELPTQMRKLKIGMYRIVLYFMCLFLDISWVKQHCNLSGGKYFPVTMNIIPVPKIWNYCF